MQKATESFAIAILKLTGMLFVFEDTVRPVKWQWCFTPL